jgi:hypothetical protein
MGFYSLAFSIPMMVVLPYCDPPSWEFPIISSLICAAGAFLAGRGVADRSAGRELPAAFAVVALLAACYLLELRVQRYPGVGLRFAVLCTQALFVMVGATVYRLRILATRKEASQRWRRYLGI